MLSHHANFYNSSEVVTIAPIPTIHQKFGNNQQRMRVSLNNDAYKSVIKQPPSQPSEAIHKWLTNPTLNDITKPSSQGLDTPLDVQYDSSPEGRFREEKPKRRPQLAALIDFKKQYKSIQAQENQRAIRSSQAPLDHGIAKQVDSRRTDFGTVIKFNELGPHADNRKAYLQSTLDQKIMLLQSSFQTETGTPKNHIQDPFEASYQHVRTRNEANHNPRVGKQPEQRGKIGPEQLNFLESNPIAYSQHHDQGLIQVDRTTSNEETDQKSSVRQHINLRSSVEPQRLNLEDLQMPELQGYKQLRIKQLDRAEQNLLTLMAENARLQKKIEVQKNLVNSKRLQTQVFTESNRKLSGFEQSLEPDNLLAEIRDYEQPVRIKSRKDSDVTAGSKDDLRLEDDIRVLSQYNHILQDKLITMQEEAIKKEASLQLQIQSLKASRQVSNLQSPEKSIREYEEKADQQKAFQSQIAVIQNKLSELSKQFGSRKLKSSNESQPDLATRREYKEELRQINRKFDQLRYDVVRISGVLLQRPPSTESVRMIGIQNADVDENRTRNVLQQQAPDQITQQLNRSSISNLLKDARENNDYGVPKHIATYNQHSQLKQLRKQHRQVESLSTKESAYVFTPGQSSPKSKTTAKRNLSLDRIAEQSPYQTSKPIPINVKHGPNFHHKVEQVGSTFTIKAVDSGLPTLQILAKKNDKPEFHMWKGDGLDKESLASKISDFAVKRQQQNQYKI